jgi:hypothetical protein
MAHGHVLHSSPRPNTYSLHDTRVIFTSAVPSVFFSGKPIFRKIPFGALLASASGSLRFGDTTLSPSCVEGGVGAGDDEDADLHARNLPPNCRVVNRGVKLRHSAIRARISWRGRACLKEFFVTQRTLQQSRLHKNQSIAIDNYGQVGIRQSKYIAISATHSHGFPTLASSSSKAHNRRELGSQGVSHFIPFSAG